MRTLAFLTSVFATPAMAHHEVIVATSLLPLMGGIATIAIAALAAIGKSRRKK